MKESLVLFLPLPAWLSYEVALLETLPHVFIFCQIVYALEDNNFLAISIFLWQNISEESTHDDPHFDDGEEEKERTQNKVNVYRSPIFKTPNQNVCF